MAMLPGLYPPAPVKWYLPLSQSTKQNPLGTGNIGASQGFGATPWHSSQGMKKHENEEEQFLCVFIQHAKELLPMDNGGLHTFCVTAYYPGEAEDVIESRKSTIVSGRRSRPEWDYEDCDFFKFIKVPYNPRQQLLMVDIFEKDVDVPEYPDELIGRTTVQLAHDKCRRMASYDVIRGQEIEGTVTLSINFPAAEEVKVDFEDEDEEEMPRGLARSKETNAFNVRNFGQGLAGPGTHKLRSSSNSTGSGSAEGSPQKDLWVPLDPPCGLNLDAPVQSILNFKGRGLPDGSMSPLPTFGPEWFRIPASNPLSRHMPPPPRVASACSDHSSANATYTLCAGPDGADGPNGLDGPDGPDGPDGADGPNGLVPTRIRGTIGTLATGHTDDGATCGDSFTR